MQSNPSGRPGAPFPKHFRLKHTRSKTGCLPCRQRKKKCDETRPSCAACRRNSLNCQWSDERRPLSSPNNHTISQLTGTSHACELTPESFKLLDHYTNVTALLLPAWTQTQAQAQNPFISVVLPLAYNDDLLMHTVLAVSGAHLSHKLAGSASAAVEQATYKHYSSVLRKLRYDISRPHEHDREIGGVMRLLAVLAFLCQYEILAGSAQTTLSLHLQAIQRIFSQLYRSGAVATSAQSDDTNNVLSFIHEGYSYMALCNLIIPTPQPTYSTDLISVTAPTLGLNLSHPLSTIFGGSRLLFEMIPQANALFCQRLAEQAAGKAEPTLAFMDGYAELSSAIETWKMPMPPPSCSLNNRQSTEDHDNHDHLSKWAQNNMAAEFIRHALRIYIMTARLGSDPPTPDAESAIQTNVEAMVHISRMIGATRSASNLMWAIIVGGSCIRAENYRRELTFWLKTSHYQMRHLELVLNALELLWADPSPKAFGPYGLRYISEKHNLTFCIM